MAATATAVRRSDSGGNTISTVTNVTFDASYPTNGLAVTAAQLGLNTVLWAVATVKTAGAGAVTAVDYDITNSKLKAYTASAEVVNATSLATVVAQVVASGY